MNYLLDTNAISEAMAQSPDARVVSWFNDNDEDRLFISVVTLAEIRFGIERMAAGRRRQQLETWSLYDLPARFEGRILQVDIETAMQWGAVTAMRRRMGHMITAMDGFIAASARRHGMALVTRNTADFVDLELSLINPWDSH